MSPKLIKKVKRLLEAPFTVFVVKYGLWTMRTFIIQHFSTIILTNWKKLSYKHPTSAEFINWFCFWILKLIPEASASGTSQALIYKCPPAHTCVVHGLSQNPTYLHLTRWISVLCYGHRNWLKKDYLWSDTTIDTEAVQQILIHLGPWTIENTQNDLIFSDFNIGV